MIIAGFPGVGKTNLELKYENVIDLDKEYIFDLTEEQKMMDFEELKGIDKPFNKDWPFCYIKEIYKKIKEYDIVLICQEKNLLLELDRQNVDYIVAYPQKDCLNDYLERYRKRGNSEEYLKRKKKSFYIEIDYLSRNTNRKWILEKGEYLEDRLIKEKVYLKERKK